MPTDIRTNGGAMASVNAVVPVQHLVLDKRQVLVQQGREALLQELPSVVAQDDDAGLGRAALGND